MAAEGLDCTPNSRRYLAAPAIASGGAYTFAGPSPFSSVATPATAWLAAWIGAPPQVLPDAPWMPICIGPAAPKPFWPLRTPGRVVWPLLLSTVPMPARSVHGTPYCCPTFLYQNRKFDGIDLALAPAGCSGQKAGTAGGRREERVRADQDGHGQQAEAHDGEEPD